MTTSLIACQLLSFALGAEPVTITPTSPTTSSQATFMGSIARRDPSPEKGDEHRSFEWTMLVPSRDVQPKKAYWLVDLRGEPHASWTTKLEEITFDENSEPLENMRPKLVIPNTGGDSVIDLVYPLVKFSESLAAGATWKSGDIEYLVEEREEREGRDAWKINVSDRLGWKRTIWWDENSKWVVALEERVFMNQGTEYLLEARLASLEELTPEELESASSVAGDLVEIRRQSISSSSGGADSGDRIPSEGREESTKRLDEISARPNAKPWANLAREVARESRNRAEKDQSIAQWTTRLLQTEIPAFDLETSSKERVSSVSLLGKVYVLHFWDYRDEPLKEPYGQVGYLEFLQENRRGDDLIVCGVVEGGATPAQVRRFRSFMNVSYSVAFDKDSLLDSLGDPRRLGAELPLFVVVGRDGKIAHVHAGYYEIDSKLGLKELNEAVEAALAAPGK